MHIFSPSPQLLDVSNYSKVYTENDINLHELNDTKIEVLRNVMNDSMMQTYSSLLRPPDRPRRYLSRLRGSSGATGSPSNKINRWHLIDNIT